MSSYFGVCFSGLSPKKIFCCWVYRAHGGFLRHDNRVIGFCHDDPAPYVSCIRQAACRAFDKGNVMGGLALHNSKAPAVPEVLTDCVVA